VGVDAVELLFITKSLIVKALLSPRADLDRGMPEYPVLRVSELFLDFRIHLQLGHIHDMQSKLIKNNHEGWAGPARKSRRAGPWGLDDFGVSPK
jgi:hypothetical protein